MKKKSIATIILIFCTPLHAITIEKLLEKHGKAVVMDAMSKKLHNTFTLNVNGAITQGVAPNKDYVTPATIAIDLARAGMTVDDIDQTIGAQTAKRKAEEIEKNDAILRQQELQAKANQERILRAEKDKQDRIRREEEDKKFWETASEAEKQQFRQAIANGNRVATTIKSPTAKPIIQTPSAAPTTHPANKIISSADRAFSTEAQVDCQYGIQRMAKYRYNWTDTGFLESKFSRFGWADDNHRILLAAGDKIEMQNGFGAFLAMTYICKIDVTTGKILDIVLNPGRF